MADISVTPGSVLPGSDAVTSDKTIGESITAGQVLYAKASDSGKMWKSQADGTAAEAAAVGIALNGGSAGQPIRVQTGGTITIGGAVTVGTIYCVSANAGGICSTTEVTTGHYVTVLGVGATTATINMGLKVSGVQRQ